MSDTAAQSPADEPNTNAAPPMPPDLPSPQASRQSRRAAIADKIRSGGFKTTTEEPAAEAAEAPAETSGAPDAATETESPEGERPAAEAAAEAEDNAEDEGKPEPKKPTAAEYAQLKKAKAAIAKREREVRREREELTRLKADLQTIQQEHAELNKLIAENPLEAMKRLSGGDVRRIFKAALEEEQVDEGEARMRQIEAQLKATSEELAAYKEADERRRAEATEAAQKAEATRTHENRINLVRQRFKEHTTAADFPYLHAYDEGLVARQVYAKVWNHYQDTGVELDLYDAFEQVNSELQQLVEPFKGVLGVGAKPAPPARGNGAVIEPAKPEGTASPATPPTLQASQATARTVGNRKLTRDERLARAAARIRKAG